MTSNEEFLTAIFGDRRYQVHVTAFVGDPNDTYMSAWAGGRYGEYSMPPMSNQYFTVSLFNPDDEGKSKRRKALFNACYCVVLDDVKEKLPVEQARKLPEPAWVLETSAGSEQWGYILREPCSDRAKIENLIDGLIENGLSPNSKDPGMKGVTRYVRLPEGFNGKANKCVGGIPFKCKLTRWNPENKCTLAQLAAPFFVDLERPRRDQRVDGASLVPDHPLLQHPEILEIRHMRSEGRYEVKCPWVDEHTGGADNGAGIFTNSDGSLGFKCHHGACESRTGRDLMRYMSKKIPGFEAGYKQWSMMRSFTELKSGSSEEKVKRADRIDIEGVMTELRREPPGTTRNKLVKVALEMCETLDAAEQIEQHKHIKDVMGWSERELTKVVRSLRIELKKRDENSDIDFFNDVIYVAEQNQFFDRRKRLWLTTDAYQNKYSHLDGEAKKSALAGGRVMKVDKLDYAPKMPPIYEDICGTTIGNAWHRGDEREGTPGDCGMWLDHFDLLGWGAQRDHILKWMAFTLRYPEQKINHMIILGGHEGSGKDWLLRPLVAAMGSNHTTIAGEELLEGFNEHILNTKHLHINEVELGNRAEAIAISNKLKPLAAAPPDKLRVNPKGAKKIEVRNILSLSMTTNSKLPIRLTGQSRRIFALWSDLNVRNSDGSLTEKWRDYWRKAWAWMDEGGVDHCIYYLRHEVDLSGFYPREAPPVTQFLQDIVAGSSVGESTQAPSNVVSFI